MDSDDQTKNSEPVTTTTVEPPKEVIVSTDETVTSKQNATNESTAPNAKKKKWRPTKKMLLIAGAITLVLGVVTLLLWPSSDNDADQNNINQQQAYNQGAAVTYTDGTVEYNIGAGWNVVTPGLSLNESDKVRTGADSRAIVTLDDGSAIRLNQNAEISLTLLSTTQVTIVNSGGEVYTRVVSSETRQFEVQINEQSYLALGTAYKTVNTYGEEGVEVYHSKVDVTDKAKVAQGESYYTKTGDADKKDKVAKIDLLKLKDDAFIVWNKTQDETQKDFADKLGVLTEIDKQEPEPVDDTPAPVTAKIVASGSKLSDGVNVSWSSSGVDTSNGFKVVYSNKNAVPSYGTDSAKYIKTGLSSTVLDLKDGKTWYIRVCAYDGDSGCSNYSNAVTVTAPYVAPVLVENGAITATLTGDILSWTFLGTAPHGFKVVWNEDGLPTYPTSGVNPGSQFLNEIDIDLSTTITDTGTYKVRVCKYTNGTESDQCVDYSNQITFIVP